MTDVTIPTKVDIDAATIQRMNEEEYLADGAIVKVVIDKSECDVTQKGTRGKGPGEDLLLKTQLFVIDPRDGQRRVKKHRLRATLTMPVTHPEYKDTHVPPSWAKGFWAQFIQVFLPEKHPKMVKGDDGSWTYKGETVEATQFDTIKAQRNLDALNECNDILGTNGKEVLNCTAYATLKHSVLEDGRRFVNADNFRPELKPDEELTDYEDLFVNIASGVEAAADETSSGGNGVTEDEDSGSGIFGRRRKK